MALVKSILFVDGENITLRYQAMLGEGRNPLPNVIHETDRFLWNEDFGQVGIGGITTDMVRINYYTTAVGADDYVNSIRSAIAQLTYKFPHDYYGKCQVMPRVYKKEAQSRKSRLVDINITIDIMRHAYTPAVDVIYLFSGDGDFIELANEVARSGKKICIGAFSSGLAPQLSNSADNFISLDDLFFQPLPILDPMSAAAVSPVTEPGALA